MRKIDKVLELLKDELVNYRKRNENLSDMVWDLKHENAMLKKDIDTYKIALEKESDTKIIKYKGKIYAVDKQTLSSSYNECEILELECFEILTKKEDRYE